jgi:hypothetical protein
MRCHFICSRYRAQSEEVRRLDINRQSAVK